MLKRMFLVGLFLLVSGCWDSSTDEDTNLVDPQMDEETIMPDQSTGSGMDDDTPPMEDTTGEM